MYISPSMTRYTSDDLGDLMGPVETQYCEVTGVEAIPDTILGVNKTDITIEFDFSPCLEFTSTEITIIDSTNLRLISQTFSIADGTVSGTIWTLPVFDFGINLDPGDYTVEVILEDSTGATSAPQFTSFTVL